MRTATRLLTKRLLNFGLASAAWLAVSDAVLAAEAAEGTSRWVLDAGKLINLVLVIAVLVWAARKPLANFFAARTQGIRQQLEEAQAARREAEARLAEIEKSMSSLDDELRRIRETAELEAQEEHRRLVAAAERDAGKLIDRARQEIEGMTRAARLELKGHVAELSVQLAKQRIQSEMTEEDQRRLFDRFVEKVGGRR